MGALTEDLVQRLSATLAHWAGGPAVQFAVLFGSVAAGRDRFGSDVDVAVAADRPLSFEESASLVDALESAVGRCVDLADLRQAGDLLVSQVLSKGRVLIRRDPAVYVEMAKRACYFQADFAPQREALMAARVRRFAHG